MYFYFSIISLTVKSMSLGYINLNKIQKLFCILIKNLTKNIFRLNTLNEKRDVMKRKSIPNVLPNGALKPISHNDLVIAKLNNDSIANVGSLDDKIPEKSDKKV